MTNLTIDFPIEFSRSSVIGIIDSVRYEGSISGPYDMLNRLVTVNVIQRQSSNKHDIKTIGGEQKSTRLRFS